MLWWAQEHSGKNKVIDNQPESMDLRGMKIIRVWQAISKGQKFFFSNKPKDRNVRAEPIFFCTCPSSASMTRPQHSPFLLSTCTFFYVTKMGTHAKMMDPTQWNRNFVMFTNYRIVASCCFLSFFECNFLKFLWCPSIPIIPY